MSGGVYRTPDSIQNLCVEIVYRPVADIFGQDHDKREGKVVKISWQRKMYSERELKYFQDKDNDKKHFSKVHFDANNRAVQGISHSFDSVLSTIVDGEDLLPHELCQQRVEQKMESIVSQRFKDTQEDYNQGSNKGIFERMMHSVGRWLIKTIDGEDEYEELMRQRNDQQQLSEKVILQQQFMQIILNPESEDDESDPIVLCTLIYEKGGRLILYPDISPSENDYYHVRMDNGQGYEFQIYNGSKSISFEEEFQEQTALREKQRHFLHTLKTQVGYHFDLPPPGFVDFTVAITIQKTRGFGGGRFFVIIGACMHNCDEGENESFHRTQLCETTEDVAHFAHPMEFSVRMSVKECQLAPTCGTVYFQINSIDSWNQQRVEGYASYPIPTTPSTSILTFPSWRPLGTLEQERRCFFLGGSIELSELSHVAPTKYLEPMLYKSNFSTISAGDIVISSCISKSPSKQ
eukprot:m.121429 g.121429  ORF g.121429 m.121429 type:complete len:463 (-) comp9377_c1_seq3:5876-7264(-)